MIHTYSIKNISKYAVVFAIMAIMMMGLSAGSVFAHSDDTDNIGEHCHLKTGLSADDIEGITGTEVTSKVASDEFAKGDSLQTSLFVEESGNGALCAYAAFKNIINLIKIVVGIASVLMISIGGVIFATAQDDTGKRDKAKNIIFSAVVGFAIVLIAQILPSIARWAFA